MNELKIFEHPKFGKIRTIVEDGKTLFCGLPPMRWDTQNPRTRLTDTAGTLRNTEYGSRPGQEQMGARL